MPYTKQTLSYFAAVLVALLFTAQACDTTSVDDHDEHADAVGMVLTQDNVEILRVENREVIWNPDGVWDEYYRDGIDALVLSPEVLEFSEVNPRGMTPSVTLRWIDADGHVFDLPDEETGDYSLSWEWEKPNTLTGDCIAQDDGREEEREDLEALDDIRPANLEQHGSDGLWGFHFRSDHAGEDRVRFSLMHDDHADFTSAWIDVVVPHDEHPLIDDNGIYMHERSKCRVDRP